MLHGNDQCYLPGDYFVRLPGIKYVALNDWSLTSIPQFSLDSLIGYIVINGVPIETVYDLSPMTHIFRLEISLDHLQCDWRLCWLLFEPFDPTNATRYLNPHQNDGSLYESINALDLDTMTCTNSPRYNGTLLKNINPLQLGCYNSKLHTVHLFRRLFQASKCTKTVFV